MKRVVVFAHYDLHNCIQDYVVYYIKELQKIAEKIIFVSDCELSEAELSKIAPHVVQSIAYHHGEYDFGSYKRGYQWANENGLLDDCEEFILANDSCYAPLFPFSEMFSKMSIKELDFWGVTANPEGLEIVDGKPIANFQDHIQSYFIVFKPQVFKSDIFDINAGLNVGLIPLRLLTSVIQPNAAVLGHTTKDNSPGIKSSAAAANAILVLPVRGSDNIKPLFAQYLYLTKNCAKSNA